ncbi:MAG: SDR family oxidoreductase [Acutalibacteraceae bacterium]|nr:SDR family oxidoreductase [Oscillospiraceae bacterium]MBQ8925568.1 SDR family oxidoreductase [Clostridia bacterium]MEE3374164.1 SDR family oxidoreductase [Acutalibacteraceae bacterium]
MAYDITTPAAQMLMGDLNDMPSLEDVFFVKGKTAIVTGGSSGLGFNVTARLLQGGANVVMASFNPAEENNACGVLEAKGFGPDRVRFFQANVTNEDDLEALIKFTDETFGSIDILVTCAAVWSYAQIYNLPKAEFEKAVGVNLTGTFLTVKHVSKYMIDHEIEGKMCLVSSNCAWLPYPTFGGYAHYAASKGGVVSLTIEAAKELKRYGIRVNTVAPGGMATEGATKNLVIDGLSEEDEDELYDGISTPQLDEIKSVDSVARVVYAMCTDFTDGITGEKIVPDNGMTHNILKYQPEISQFPED